MSSRFALKVLTPELVSPTYLSWFVKENSSEFIAYAKNQVTLESLKEYAQQKLESPEALFIGIFTHDESKHIGNIKFEPINFELGYAVLGILIGDPEWRGKGVFAEISESLEKTLKLKGIRKIYLGVEKENAPAVKAYYKTGYIDDDENFLKIDTTIAHSMVKVL
jgi:ribosomal-protein-alanine N-acetyltransferase